MLAALQCRLVKLGFETMGDRYGCPGRTLDSWRERNRSSQRHFLGLVVLQTKAIAWTG